MRNTVLSGGAAICPGRVSLLLAFTAMASLFTAPISVAQDSTLLGASSASPSAPPLYYVEIEGRQVAVWKPAGPAPVDGYPLVVFSHGFDLCETQATFMTEAWAQAGYFVLAPHHHDAACKRIKKIGRRPEESFRKPEDWNDTTYLDRRDDVEAVLNAALRDKSFEGVPIDHNRVGLAGHSLGGYTILGLAGAWPSWKDPRIKVLLLMAPYCIAFLNTGNLAHLNLPVMYQVGSGDVAITPTVVRPGGGYELTSAPKYLVEFSEAGHLAWTNTNRLRHDPMEDYALAFLDRYLKGVTSPDPLAPLLASPWPSSVRRLDYADK